MMAFAQCLDKRCSLSRRSMWPMDPACLRCLDENAAHCHVSASFLCVRQHTMGMYVGMSLVGSSDSGPSHAQTGKMKTIPCRHVTRTSYYLGMYIRT